MNPEQVRREMEALFPGLETNEALQTAFRAHPGAERYLEDEPELGRSIPWVLVRCEIGGKTITGLVVSGTSARHGWNLEEAFVMFTTDVAASGAFVPVTHGTATVSVIGTVPGTNRNPRRPDAVTLLGQLAEITARWASDRRKTDAWGVWSRVHGQPAFPECFVEFHRGDEVTRGLVIAGALDAAGGWDFTRPVHLMIWPAREITLDPTQAEWKEVLHGDEVPQSRRG